MTELTPQEALARAQALLAHPGQIFGEHEARRIIAGLVKLVTERDEK